ncbi:choice-of-anchor L domain-containing protein [Winogradskyella litorisediminis]|uniref:Choice-of-anchor L domain-containing protein n=1 Tax=Winogradskyella litorisediminis TaxID=1156618 RepID=A0ABW3N775_9FLAO
MKYSYPNRFYKLLFFVVFLFAQSPLFAQNINMQNGIFNRCAPDRFFDSGGEFGNYNSNENFEITLCPTNPGEVIILDFVRFNTQVGEDIMTIYDGDSTASPVIGNFSGTMSPGRVNSTDASGCLTITYSTNGFGNTTGWEADIICATACQTITASIDSTTPAVNPITNQINILASQTVNFEASATYSDTDANATYLWNFGTGGTATTLTTSHQFNTSGTFDVTFTASDNNPLGCSDTQTVRVVVADPFVTINNSAFPESFLAPPDLIDEVLVTGGCSAVGNFITQVSGAPLDNQNKSYGYFTRGGTDFPFDEGIVLTNGVAFQGGNTASAPIVGTDNGFGEDLDLETAVGITDSRDATFIQFDFTPTTDNISFRYIMASEEYNMNDECSFADSFAFLLRVAGSGDPYQNLAVLANGTTVNVTNINGISCPGAPQNPDAFAGYNLGDTNYGGRTEVLTASAVVIPNTTYEIKLVVADAGTDSIFDTAIFIEAGSFNLGGDLGDDITLANGTAPCGDIETVTLDTQAPDATHTWFFNGMPIAGAGIGSTLVIDEAGTYSVNVEFAPGCSTTDEIIVEFRESPEIVATPEDLAGCNSTGIAEFNLEQNTPIVFGSQDDTQFAITYHNSLAEAESGANPIIADLNNYSGTDGEIIFIRLDDIATEQCVLTTSFTLNVFSNVSAEDDIYELCDNNDDGDDTNGEVEFNLPSRNPIILGTQNPTQFTVSYHLNFADADNGQNPLPDMYTNTTANSQVIFSRVQNNSAIECYAVSSVTLQVNELPTITNSVDLLQCDDDTDGISNFNLTESNELISTNAAAETFTYYTDLADAQAGINAITNELSYPNTDPSATPDLLFVRVENANSCFRVAELELFVSTTQIPAGFAIPPYQECDDTRLDDNITDGITIFDFSNATSQIEAVFPPGQIITISYYESEADALAETNAITDTANHINSASPFNQTIYFRIENDTDNSCLGLGNFELETINPIPRTDTESVDIIQCDDVTIGNNSEEFDLTQNEAFIFDGEPNLDARYFLSYNDALNDIVANEIITPTAYINTNVTETIYVRVQNNLTSCFAIVDFDITVNPLPTVVPVSPLEECENGTDFVFTFDLGEKRDEILNGQDPTQFDVTFHISQADADNLNNPQPDMFENTANPQEIFFAITNNITTCSNSTGSFFIEVFEGAQANPDGEPLDFELCDDESNDGSEQFDLRTLQDEVHDGQDPDDYTLTYHFSEIDAIDNANELPFLYENLTNPQTIWVRVSNNISPDLCFEVQPVPLIVNPSPEFSLEDLYILCTSTNGSEVVPVPPVIDTGLSDAIYDFEWFLDNVLLPTETNPSLVPTQGGTYTVIVTDTTTSTVTQCTNSAETVVLESEVPIVDAEVVSEAFSANHTVEATTLNVGDFEFSLDLGPYQDFGTFENVTPGIHTVYARDINGCGVGSTQILVMDYPRFFTPNGDGNNDTWNIVGIGIQPNSKIYIFDRYGKLLKQLSPTSFGWDGTYQGNLMPSDDYWFTVEYVEPLTGETMQQTAHFSLKR